jgi:hypothetical protein
MMKLVEDKKLITMIAYRLKGSTIVGWYVGWSLIENLGETVCNAIIRF